LDWALADHFQRCVSPKIASALYGRGLARMKKGDRAAGEADFTAAKALKSDIVAEFSRYGVN